jgi:hypothetical protein
MSMKSSICRCCLVMLLSPVHVEIVHMADFFDTLADFCFFLFVRRCLFLCRLQFQSSNNKPQPPTSVKLYLQPKDFIKQICNYEIQDFVDGVYNSQNFTKTHYRLDTDYVSVPDSFIVVEDKVKCVGWNATVPCQNFTRTLVLPSFFDNGAEVNGIYFGMRGNCTKKSLLTLAVNSVSGSSKHTVECHAMNEKEGFGIMSPDVIYSVTMTSSFVNYDIDIIGLASISCPNKLSLAKTGITSGAKKRKYRARTNATKTVVKNITASKANETTRKPRGIRGL